MSPNMSKAILRALDEIRAKIAVGNITQAEELTRLLLSIEDKIPASAFAPVKAELQKAMGESVRFGAKQLPAKAQAGAMFDVLNENHLTAVRDLDTAVIKTLREEVRDVIRAHIENGLRDGVGPRTIARGIRDVVGLAPQHEEWVRNFRSAAERAHLSGKATNYQLRDRRFDSVFQRARKSGNALTADQIERATTAYRRRLQAYHANTVATTATLDTLKRGQHLAWEQAVERGAVDPNRLTKTWVQVDRPTKRDEHVPLHGETVHYKSNFSNGEFVPGETTWNCACLARYSTLKQIAEAPPPPAPTTEPIPKWQSALDRSARNKDEARKIGDDIRAKYENDEEFQQFRSAVEDWQSGGSLSDRDYPAEIRKAIDETLRGDSKDPRALALLRAVNRSKPDAPGLFRGIYSADDEASILLQYRQGRTFDMPMSSFSSEESVAQRISAWGETAKPQRVIFKLDRGSQSVRVENLSYSWDEREWFTGGRFRVKSSSKRGEFIEILLEQTGVFNVK
jgi:hypothetical protein